MPGVHSIPLLGWLFKDRAVNNSKSELLIFITANIIPISV
ncbi:MAG: type II and III secretion system protein [Deltaproteobacteria bacterium]|nr:type II and III secretion system protein [Deltaproteobacteria bacterium]